MGFFISSPEIVSYEGTFSFVYSVSDGVSGDYVGKVLRPSLVTPSKPEFWQRLFNEFKIASFLKDKGFSVPKHYGVFDLDVPHFGKNPCMVMQRIYSVPVKTVQRDILERARSRLYDERSRVREDFYLPADFDRNLLFSEDEQKFYMIDFGFWLKR